MSRTKSFFTTAAIVVGSSAALLDRRHRQGRPGTGAVAGRPRARHDPAADGSGQGTAAASGRHRDADRPELGTALRLRRFLPPRRRHWPAATVNLPEAPGALPLPGMPAALPGMPATRTTARHARRTGCPACPPDCRGHAGHHPADRGGCRSPSALSALRACRACRAWDSRRIWPACSPRRYPVAEPGWRGDGTLGGSAEPADSVAVPHLRVIRLALIDHPPTQNGLDSLMSTRTLFATTAVAVCSSAALLFSGIATADPAAPLPAPVPAAPPAPIDGLSAPGLLRSNPFLRQSNRRRRIRVAPHQC